MTDRIDEEERLIEALRITSDPPQAWIDAAALIPSTLGSLASLEPLIASDEFRARFAASPESAIAEVGLPGSPALVAALRAQLA